MPCISGQTLVETEGSRIAALLAGCVNSAEISINLASLRNGSADRRGGRGPPVILTMGKAAPPIVTAALPEAAQNYLRISPTPAEQPDEAERIKIDGTPALSDPQAERLALRLDGE